jgi:hypothetical protein
MTTMQLEAEVSTEQLLRAVEQLPPREFAALLARLLALRAGREEPRLSQQETSLLLQINKGIAPRTQRRFDDLVARRRAETITADELDELIKLTDQIERHDARRLEALHALAQLRGQTLSGLLVSLDIPLPTHA